MEVLDGSFFEAEYPTSPNVFTFGFVGFYFAFIPDASIGVFGEVE